MNAHVLYITKDVQIKIRENLQVNIQPVVYKHCNYTLVMREQMNEHCQLHLYH